MVLVRGGAGRVGDGSCGTSWAVTHFEGNAWRSASSICWPRGASVSVAAARGWTARRDPRGAFVVPAPVVVFVFGARRRCGTAAIRAPSIDADSIVADIIARAGVVTRCVLTRRALVRCVGRAATFRFIWISESSISKVPIVFFLGKNQRKKKAKHVRPAAVGWLHTDSSESSRTIPQGIPQSRRSILHRYASHNS